MVRYLDPTTPEGRLLMFKKDIMPGRIRYAMDTGYESAWQAVKDGQAEIERLERELSNG